MMVFDAVRVEKPGVPREPREEAYNTEANTNARNPFCL
jgi:hypothetical protein